MNELLPYILKSTLCLSLFYMAFRTMMRKETFFTLNRMVLLIVVICSIIIPLLHLPQMGNPLIQEQVISQIQFNETPMQPMEVVESPISAALPDTSSETKPLPYSTGQIFLLIYLAGMLVSLLYFLHGIISVLLMLRKAQVIKKEGLFILEKDIPAFSFGKMVFISRADYRDHGTTILAHEQQHIRLGHFYDLLLMETTKMIHWFNPVVYLLIQDLKAIHEYQADQQTLTKGIDATTYQLLIIEKGVGQQRLALANSFNHCQIKKRITMMNKQSTGKAWRWKVATFLPLLALLLMAFGRTGESKPMEIKSAQIQPQAQPSSIIGTWKLISYNYNGGDKLIPLLPVSQRIKFITETNFNWVHYAGEEKLVTSSAGGTYVLSGDSYTENIEFGGQDMTDYIGKTQKFNIKIEDNKMHLSGELSSGLRIKEVWERVESKVK